MKKIWLRLADYFDARSPRERFTVFLGLTALILALAYVLGIEPALARQQKASRILAESTRVQAQLSEQEIALIAAESADPDSRLRAQIAQLQDAGARQRAELTAAQSRLASPEKMTSVLRDLIAGQKGLELHSLRSLPPEDLMTSQASAPASSGIYRHGIEVTVSGNFADLSAYARQIENLPWKVLPGSLILKTETYPKSNMTLTLYTLSLERAWLSF